MCRVFNDGPVVPQLTSQQQPSRLSTWSDPSSRKDPSSPSTLGRICWWNPEASIVLTFLREPLDALHYSYRLEAKTGEKIKPSLRSLGQRSCSWSSKNPILGLFWTLCYIYIYNTVVNQIFFTLSFRELYYRHFKPSLRSLGQTSWSWSSKKPILGLFWTLYVIYIYIIR